MGNIYKKVPKIKPTDGAWLGGLIDGEGTISLMKHSNKDKFRRPTLEIPTTTPVLLERVVKILGVGIIIQKKKYKEHHLQSYTWSVTNSNQVIDILCQIQIEITHPQKRNRADKIVSEYKKVTRRNGRYTESELQHKKQFEESFFLL
jgi:hypothetical protein